MTAETLIKLRNQHSKDDAFVVYAFQGTSVYVFSGLDFTIFDDAHEVIHFVRVATPGVPEWIKGENIIAIKSVPYDYIYYVSSSEEGNEFKTKWSEGFFKENGLLTDKQIEIINHFADVISNINYNARRNVVGTFDIVSPIQAITSKMRIKPYPPLNIFAYWGVYDKETDIPLTIDNDHPNGLHSINESIIMPSIALDPEAVLIKFFDNDTDTARREGKIQTAIAKIVIRNEMAYQNGDVLAGDLVAI